MTLLNKLKPVLLMPFPAFCALVPFGRFWPRVYREIIAQFLPYFFGYFFTVSRLMFFCCKHFKIRYVVIALIVIDVVYVVSVWDVSAMESVNGSVQSFVHCPVEIIACSIIPCVFYAVKIRKFAAITINNFHVTSRCQLSRPNHLIQSRVSIRFV